MRGILLSLAFVTAAAIAAPQAAPVPALTGGSTISASASYDLQSAPNDVNIDINVNHGGGYWYRNPLWIGVGALAVIVLLLIIVLAARGGGTTIVKD